MAQLQSIYRYPVKGLSPKGSPRVRLNPVRLCRDRFYAIENGPSGFDPAAPAYLPKTRFLMLMRNERLATLRTHYEEQPTAVVRGRRPKLARGDSRTTEGARDRAFFRASCRRSRGPPKVLHAAHHSFSDVAARVVSIINLASVAALERLVGDRSIRCAFAAISMSAAGRPGRVRSARTGNRRRRRTAEGHQTHRAVRGDRRRTRDRHPRPENPATLAATSVTWIAASTRRWSLAAKSAGGETCWSWISQRRHSGSGDGPDLESAHCDGLSECSTM